MRTLQRIAVTLAFLLLTAAYAQAQLPTDPEQRARIIAQNMQALSSRQGDQNLNNVGILYSFMLPTH